MKINGRKIIFIIGLISVFLVGISRYFSMDYQLRSLKEEIYQLNEYIGSVDLNKAHPLNFSIDVYMREILSETESKDLLDQIKEITLTYKENILAFYEDAPGEPSFGIYLDLNNDKRFEYRYDATYYENVRKKDIVDDYKTWDLHKLK